MCLYYQGNACCLLTIDCLTTLLYIAGRMSLVFGSEGVNVIMLGGGGGGGGGGGDVSQRGDTHSLQ